MPSPTNLNRRQVLSYAGLIVVLLFFLTTISGNGPSRLPLPRLTHEINQPSQPNHRNAFCVFLSEPNVHIKEGAEDVYYMGTRMLIYQLLHDPETRTNTSIPFLVLVTKAVPQWKRDQLTLDGAIVSEVSEIKYDWIKPGRPRWEHVMDKLHIFELVEYDKILLFDADIVVFKRLDGIFEDPATAVMQNLNNASNIASDEGPQPAEFLMAGNGGPRPDHTYPAPRHGKLNAGFVVFKPSIEMYEYYLSVASIEGRFPGSSPEQDLWNYAHRRNGNMPWQQLHPDWTVNNANWGDYEGGVASVHEKYWKLREPRLREKLMQSRWKMEGFFNFWENRQRG